jgi:transcriptional regulator with XRE-family HTH domain
MKYFANNLKSLRKAMGLNQSDIAQHISKTKQCVSDYEAEKVLPGVDTLQMIGHFFGVTLDEMLSARIDAKRAEKIIAKKTEQADYKQAILEASLPSDLQSKLSRLKRMDIVTMMSSERFAIIDLAKNQRQVIEELEEEYDKSRARNRELAERLDEIQKTLAELGIDL